MRVKQSWTPQRSIAFCGPFASQSQPVTATIPLTYFRKIHHDRIIVFLRAAGGGDHSRTANPHHVFESRSGSAPNRASSEMDRPTPSIPGNNDRAWRFIAKRRCMNARLLSLGIRIF
jgi:hypothetical protein